MKRVKVLQLRPHYNVSSCDAVDLAEQIVKSLPAEEFEVVNCFLTKRPKNNTNESSAERNIYLNLNKNDFRGLRFKMTLKILRLLKNEAFDVVLCHRFKPTAVMMRIHRWVGKPKCISVVHSFSDYKPKSRRKILSKFGALQNWNFVTVSEALKDHLLQLKIGFNDTNTVSITNAIDVEKAIESQLSRFDARKKLGLPEDAKIIGTIGRLVKVKGHQYLIQAFAKIHDQYPDVIVAIIGEGDERPYLEKLIRQLGLSKKIYLLGSVEGAVKYVRAFDIWTLPSLSEGLGLALLEGMSAKLPCIGSDIPALRPLLTGSEGKVCPPADAGALAERLSEYLAMSDEDLRKKGNLAYEYLKTQHSIEDFRSAYFNLVQKVL